jgi:hypothetical protein
MNVASTMVSGTPTGATNELEHFSEFLGTLRPDAPPGSPAAPLAGVVLFESHYPMAIDELVKLLFEPHSRVQPPWYAKARRKRATIGEWSADPSAEALSRTVRYAYPPLAWAPEMPTEEHQTLRVEQGGAVCVLDVVARVTLALLPEEQRTLVRISITRDSRSDRSSLMQVSLDLTGATPALMPVALRFAREGIVSQYGALDHVLKSLQAGGDAAAAPRSADAQHPDALQASRRVVLPRLMAMSVLAVLVVCLDQRILFSILSAVDHRGLFKHDAPPASALWLLALLGGFYLTRCLYLIRCLIYLNNFLIGYLIGLVRAHAHLVLSLVPIRLVRVRSRSDEHGAAVRGASPMPLATAAAHNKPLRAVPRAACEGEAPRPAPSGWEAHFARCFRTCLGQPMPMRHDVHRLE